MLNDLRFALRTIGRRPALAAAVIGTLAIGIGASTAIFSFVDGVLLKPLPFPDTDRLVAILETNLPQGIDRSVVSPRNLEDWQRASSAIAEFGAWRDWGFRLATPDGPRGVAGGIASPSLFRLLQVEPAAGRLFLDEENEPGSDRVVLASYRFWQRDLGGRADAIGSTLNLRGEAYRVVGVLPPLFDTPEMGWVDLWAPLSVDPDQRMGRFVRNRRVYARLAPGATIAGARAELEGIAAALAREFPDTNAGWGVRVMPLLEFEVGTAARTTLTALSGAAILLLLVACANVAHLLLVQASAGERDLAVRMALGAGRGALLRHLVALGVTLATAGGGAGALLAWPAVRFLVALAPAGVPRLGGVAVDARALAFALAAGVVTGVAFSLWPALRGGRIDLAQALRDATRSSSGVESRRLRRALVAAEVALTVVLLAVAGLLGRTVLRLTTQDAGFDPSRLFTVQLFMPDGSFDSADRRSAFYREAIAAAASLPGVEAAAGTSAGPNFGGQETAEVAVVGRPAPAGGQLPLVRYYDVGPGYFRTMGIPVLRGRELTDADDLSAPGVALINETGARRLFPGEDPLGRRLRRVRWEDEIEIVGVVADSRSSRLGSVVEAELYWPYHQGPRYATYIVLRSAMAPAALEAAIRARVRAADPGVLVTNAAPMSSLIERTLRTPRFRLLLAAGFATLSVGLAMVGVFGVVSYAASRRTREIGVRLALGAQRSEVLRLVFLDGMRPVAAGLALGVAGAVLAGRAVRTLLFGVSPLDLPALAGAVALVLACAALACALPARRAAALDPVAALRYE
jgi:putative ABC transport system permease protein